MLPKKVPKSSENFSCEKCKFVTSRKSQYDRHLLTRKHKILTHTDASAKKSSACEYVCECGKLYKHRQSLFIHKKKCDYLGDEVSVKDIDDMVELSRDIEENQDYKGMFYRIMKENSEFKNLLITQQKQIIEQQIQIGELIPKVGNNNNNIKQKFNINIFLNEQCRDAINMDDFLKQIEVSLQQLDLTKTKGITEGLSNVFIENMSKLSIYERPLHCTDAKRETLYIKENDVWEKDNDKTRIKAAIKYASMTQYKTMQKWIDANPDYMDYPDKQEYFINMVKNCGKNIEDIDDKIIKKICTTSYIKDILQEN